MESLRLETGCEIEYECIDRPDSDGPTLVFLHEGLGCVALWRDFPARVATAASMPALVYSRYGYGRSTPFEAAPDDRFMHDAARSELPAVLAAFAIRRPVLIGHSDGASIALIYAGDRGKSPAEFAALDSAPAPLAVVALAPHLFVETICIEAIAEAARRFSTSGLEARLGRYHRDATRTFRGWSGVWLSGGFPSWNIENCVRRIECPVLAIQGTDDQYGTMRQIRRIAELVPDAMLLELPHVGHAPHLDASERVAKVVSGWLGSLSRASSAGSNPWSEER